MISDDGLRQQTTLDDAVAELAKKVENGLEVAEESDEEQQKDTGPVDVAEKWKAQSRNFKTWALNQAEKITAVHMDRELHDKKDEGLSVRDLLHRQERPKTIKNPRDYQLELFERAKAENTIAVLDTGSGKTLIAVLLLRHVIDEELERQAAGHLHRISFFLVHSVALVFQQAAVLECNLDHPVAHFCGAMGTDLWSKAVWQNHFASSRVIVCTAEVLYQCLWHSYLHMEQINLLIFDEAHHAKKDDPYAKIMREFYATEVELSKRPRVFGMTASPVDAKVDVIEAARELERLLHARIATTTSGSLIEFQNRVSQQTLVYPPLRTPFETPLYKQMKSKFGNIGSRLFQRLFIKSKDASSKLGAWASDKLWELALTDEQQVRRTEMSMERAYHKENGSEDTTQLDTDFAILKEAAELVSNHALGNPQAGDDSFSPKVLTLSNLLGKHFERPTSNKCLVFVEQRQTARLLAAIFKLIGSPHLHSGVITGASGGSGDSQSLHQQVLTMTKFRRGELNCLFATSVAEEGLDIPECNLVVRFDLYKSMIQFVQSKGRARQPNSKFVNMIEQNNAVHEKSVRDALQAAQKMQQYCAQQPEDRLLKGNDEDIDDALLRDLDGDKYSFTHPETGARLTYNSALVVLSHFCSTLPTEERGNMLQPTYIISTDRGSFVCEVVMPEQAPVRSLVGSLSPRKAIARRSAAFQMCAELLKSKYLDSNLLPVYKKALPLMRNAKLALDMHKKNAYAVRIKPSIWASGRGRFPQELYLTTICFSDGLDRPHQPLGLLTRSPLPEIPKFPLFLTSGSVTLAVLKSGQKALSVDLQLAAKLTRITLCVFKDVFAKEFEFDPTKMSWWIVPIHGEAQNILSDPFELIDWPQVNYVHENEDVRWTPEMPSDFLHDKFFVDPWDGARRAFTSTVNNDLKATDPVPVDGIQKSKHALNILDYSVSLWKRSREFRSWNEAQPVVNAEQLLHRRNFLSEPITSEVAARTKVYLCPEPMRISALSTRFVVSCIVFPAIIHRVEDYLVALEACDLIGIKISAGTALEACTKDSDNNGDGGSGDGQFNFRPGMGANYERLEFLGDCFLKMATSIALFGQRPNDDEFEFHVLRMCLVCNQNLFNTAKDVLKLPEYIRSLAFSRRLWYPEGIKMLVGKGADQSNETNSRLLGDKTVADVCEALIGAAFVEYDKPGRWSGEQWDSAVRAVTVFVNHEDHKMLKWGDYVKAYQKPAYQTAETTASQRDLATKVALEHSYVFRYPRLLRSAFCHPSHPFSWEKVPSYQRLEFLGDSLIDMACVTHLYYRYPNKDPQWLTEHKMAMVSNKFLGALCVKLGFYRHLRYSDQHLEFQIREYVTEVQEAENEANGAADYWIGVKQPPKCLPDIVEAYVGAIFVDSSFNYAKVQKFFDQHIKPFFVDMAVYDTFANNHPTTQLHNLLSTELGCTAYRVMSEELPAATPGSPPKAIAGVMVHDRIVADGVAESSRYAKIKASLTALKALQGLAPYEFRMKFGCDCKQSANVERKELAEMGTNI